MTADHNSEERRSLVRSRRLSAEETARHGDQIYERAIRGRVEAEHAGGVVAIDIKTGEYAASDNALTAARRLRDHHPNAEIWFVRVGSSALHRIGAHAGSDSR